MLDEAKKNVEAAPGDAKVETLRGDALAPPFHEEFDVVTSVGAFGHIQVEDEDRFIAGIHRCLRPGGRFVFVTAPPPPATSKWFWAAHGFNAVMRVRNAVLDPPFIMYYLTFQWPEIAAKLTRAGFTVKAHENKCPPPFVRAVIVEATK
jgi:cyclopropane fatty-acyl-phospholipid synthase-like methyltransferase